MARINEKIMITSICFLCFELLRGDSFHHFRPQTTEPRRKRSLVVTPEVKTIDLIKMKGYLAEAHSVTTEDGYILELHRIPYGINSSLQTVNKTPTMKTGPPILLMHCLFCSSIDWFLNDPDKALGFILADEGYDVWVANARGNPYSLNHVSLSTKEQEFWMFGFHEIAILDLPAIINHILEVTGHCKLSYVGYSLGSVVLYVLMSERPEYNEKIKVAAILGPAAYLTHSKGSLFQFSGLVNIIEKVSEWLGIWQIQEQGLIQNLVATTLCHRENAFLSDLCFAIYSNFLQIDREFVNQDYLPLILWKVPSGGSLKTLFHLMQVKNADRFQQYNYGVRTNIQHYGTSMPPVYHINRTQIPIGLFAGCHDDYVAITDVERLARELPNVVFRHDVVHKKFSHFDFLWAKDVTQILYKHVLRLLRDYN